MHYYIYFSLSQILVTSSIYNFTVPLYKIIVDQAVKLFNDWKYVQVKFGGVRPQSALCAEPVGTQGIMVELEVELIFLLPRLPVNYFDGRIWQSSFPMLLHKPHSINNKIKDVTDIKPIGGI